MPKMSPKTMVKVKCLFGIFKINNCKLELVESRADSIIKTAFDGSMKLGVGDPSAGDPDMVIAKRMLRAFPATGKIIEYKPPEIDPDVVY
jgi:hypothetical protein